MHLFLCLVPEGQRTGGPRTVRILSFIQYRDIEQFIYYVPFTIQDTDDTVLDRTDKKALPACSEITI